MQGKMEQMLQFGRTGKIGNKNIDRGEPENIANYFRER